MSYNLTTNLYKVKSDINIINKRDKIIIFDEHLVMSYEDNFINYYDIDFDDVNIHKLEFEKLKEKYKMIKMVVPFFDFLPVLKNKNINPEDYVRVEIFNCLDMATYVKKDFLEKNEDEIFNIANESRFKEDKIIFIYEPIKSEREIDALILEEVESEFTACFLDRYEYHKFLPSPLSKNWWGFYQITTSEDFERFKNSGDNDRPIKNWNFVESENIALVIY